jgi:hypothetical protein
MASLWFAHAQTRPWTALGLGLSVMVTLWLLGASVARIASGEAEMALRLAMLGGLAGFAATAFGALPALGLRALAQRAEDVMLGLAAGMMLAASSFSLILPGLAGRDASGSARCGCSCSRLRSTTCPKAWRSACRSRNHDDARHRARLIRPSAVALPVPSPSPRAPRPGACSLTNRQKRLGPA